MKIITWNCNGAFRKKHKEIEKLDADLYVIQECENPEHVKGECKNWADSYVWHGEGKDKGIGIFAHAGIQLQRLDWQD